MVLICQDLSLLNYTFNKNGRELMNMEIGIICVWDSWGIAYECFGLCARQKAWNLYKSVQERERERQKEKQNSR